jgi:hypothetical protein
MVGFVVDDRPIFNQFASFLCDRTIIPLTPHYVFVSPEASTANGDIHMNSLYVR